MQRPAKFTEIRMGNLIFVTADLRVIGYDQDTNQFGKVLGETQRDHGFLMALSTCAGVLVRALDPNAAVPVAMAHVPSIELGKKLVPGRSYSEIRAIIDSSEGRKQIATIVPLLAQGNQEAAEEAVASLYSPILDLNFLARTVMETMGKEIEVRIFGGAIYGRERVPDIVTAIESEFQQAAATSVVIEHSVLDLDRRQDVAAMIVPFAGESRDLVRPTRKLQVEEYSVIKLNLKLDG